MTDLHKRRNDFCGLVSSLDLKSIRRHVMNDYIKENGMNMIKSMLVIGKYERVIRLARCVSKFLWSRIRVKSAKSDITHFKKWHPGCDGNDLLRDSSAL
jgi:hypothetical protein